MRSRRRGRNQLAERRAPRREFRRSACAGQARAQAPGHQPPRPPRQPLQDASMVAPSPHRPAPAVPASRQRQRARRKADCTRAAHCPGRTAGPLAFAARHRSKRVRALHSPWPPPPRPRPDRTPRCALRGPVPACAHPRSGVPTAAQRTRAIFGKQTCARCPAHGDQGCLDGDGSGTAEWIAAGLVAAKACRQDHRSDNPASVTLGVASRPGLAGTNPVRGVRNRAGEPTAAAKHARGRGPPGPHAQTGVRKRNRTPSDCAPSRWAGRSWAGRGARGPS